MSTKYSVMSNAGNIVKRSTDGLDIAAYMLGRKISDFTFLKRVESTEYAKVVCVMACKGDVNKLAKILEEA